MKNELPKVYMVSDITPAGLMTVYEALDREATGNVAVKLSTGEAGSNYLRAELIQGLVASTGTAIVESNTTYGGTRNSTVNVPCSSVTNGIPINGVRAP